MLFCTLCDMHATCKGTRMELSGSWFWLCFKSHPQRWEQDPAPEVRKGWATCRVQNIRGEYMPLFGGCACSDRASGDSTDSRVSLNPQLESQSWHFLDLWPGAVHLTSKWVTWAAYSTTFLGLVRTNGENAFKLAPRHTATLGDGHSFPCPRVFLGQESDPWIFFSAGRPAERVLQGGFLRMTHLHVWSRLGLSSRNLHPILVLTAHGLSAPTPPQMTSGYALPLPTLLPQEPLVCAPKAPSLDSVPRVPHSFFPPSNTYLLLSTSQSLALCFTFSLFHLHQWMIR